MDIAALLLSLLAIVKGIALTVIGFGLMVFFHELGHFLAAKLMGVRVERFSFGMPPKLFGRKWGETEYVVSAIPIGGYVKLAGGDEGQEATGAPDEFTSKPPGQRAVILAAGPIFSILFGVPLAIGMLLLGREDYLAKVSETVVDGAAWNAGVRSGDRITGLAGYQFESFEKLRQVAAEMPADTPVPLTIERPAQTLLLPLRVAAGEPTGLTFQPDSTQVAQVAPGSAAAKAGLLAGDRIVTVDRRLVRDPAEFERSLARPPTAEPPLLLVERGDRRLTLTVERRRGERLGVACHYNMLRIGNVAPKSAALAAGIKPGDVILRANGHVLRGWSDFRRHILASADRPLRLDIERDGQAATIEATPKAIKEEDPGFTIRLPREVGYVRPGFPADGKLMVGDTLLSVNGRPVTEWSEIEDAVAEGPERVALQVQRSGQTLAIELERNPGARLGDMLGMAPRPVYLIASVHQETRPAVQVGDEIIRVGREDVAKAIPEGALYTPLQDVLTYIAKSRAIRIRRDGAEVRIRLKPGTRFTGQLGVEPTPVAAMHRETLLGSIVPALQRTYSIGTFAFVVLWKLVSGDISIWDLMGPVGILQQTYLSATSGLADLFWLIHLITVNIGAFNLIPIPPLDGGRIAMLAYEKIRGRQPSRRLQEAILLAGVALVILIFLVATFNDVQRLIP